MADELISIIVPIYNVEKYLKRESFSTNSSHILDE
ncbi:Uncharacterised protein [Streptococcus pneumoniae]|nr:Uncharacterised protein [Streptococcus pneumoniae]